jgi:dTDP-L-rhamnose 4-epimerase
MKNLKRVLITGGAGFIGAHTSDLLVKNGYHVTIIDSLSSKTHENNFPKYINNEVIKIKGDVRDKKVMTDVLSQTDYVIHLAAEMDLNPEFQKFIDVNVGSTALLYEIIVENKFKINKILIASSQFVYGQGLWNCKSHGDFKPDERKFTNFLNDKWDHYCPICNEIGKYKNCEESHSNPPNHYAISKYFQEELAIRLGKLYNIPTVAMRYSIVHGPRQSLKNTYSGALRNFAISIKLNKELATFEDNNSKRDFISVFDIASANQFLLENEKANFQVFNIGGQKSYTVKQLAELLAEKMNMEYKFSNTIEFRKGDIRHAISSSNKILNLGWEYKHDEESAIEEYVSWFKNQYIDKENFEKIQNKIRSTGVVIKVK